jgi:multidrug resistance efflux pump
MSVTRKVLLWACGILAVLVLGAAAYGLAHSPGQTPKGNGESPEQTDAREENTTETSVMAIHPRSDPSLYLTVQQLLSVEPFFVADLRAQIAGEVRDVQKDIGDPVKRGEILVDIKTPDLEEALHEKETIVAQRKQDLQVAYAQAENASAVVEVYREIIKQREADYLTAVATCDRNKLRFDRYTGMQKSGTLLPNLVDEEQRDYLAAGYAVQGAQAGVRKAEADLREKESALRIVLADIELKKSLIEVARKSRDRARAMLDYTQITAPFDGVVVKRKVDIGTFVQNASTGSSEPLLTIARNDIVTLVMKVPDDAAPYVTHDTEAVIQIDGLRDVVIRGKVTRFSPWIQNHDRTMRVEVDLYNDTPEKYERFKARALAARLAGTAAASPLALTTLLATTRAVCSADSKSFQDPLPSLPVVNGRKTPPRLIPGMSGYMRLNLQAFHDTYLIPSSAVFTRGGKPYILEVVDGVTHLLPVRVQITDGKLSKVLVIVHEEMPAQGQAEELRELTGDQVIVLNRQAEIGEEQPVKVTLEKW